MKKHFCLLALTCFLFSALAGCATVQGDWEKARKSDTVSAYKAFRGNHPDSEFDGQASKRIEEIEWARARKQGAASAYRTFAMNYPKSLYADEAERRAADLDRAAAKRLREMKFEMARKAETVAAFEEFLKDYPQGNDSDTLRRELPALREWEPRRQLAERIIRLCPRGTLTAKSLLEGTRQVPSPTYAKDLAEIRSLLDRGVDPNSVRIAGWVPRKETQGISFLRGVPVITRRIEVGDPGHPVPPDMPGMTLLEYCKANGLSEAYDLLKSHGAE